MSEARPIALDLYCGLGGWAQGFLAEGYDVIGFDIERHDYGRGGYPGMLVLQDVQTLTGKQFVPIINELACIVASPPCQAYSYRAMPWKRAKALPPPDNTLFEQPFRIQREIDEATGKRVPLIVENVCGAQKWVGRAAWHFGSFYLWGDLPALMPMTMKTAATKVGGTNLSSVGFNVACVRKLAHGDPNISMADGRKLHEYMNIRDGHSHTRHLTNPAEHGTKGFTPEGQRMGANVGPRRFFSKSDARKRSSAEIAMIPFPLAQHIAQCFRP